MATRDVKNLARLGTGGDRPCDGRLIGERELCAWVAWSAFALLLHRASSMTCMRASEENGFSSQTSKSQSKSPWLPASPVMETKKGIG